MNTRFIASALAGFMAAACAQDVPTSLDETASGPQFARVAAIKAPPVAAIEVHSDGIACLDVFRAGEAVCLNSGPTFDDDTDISLLTFRWNFGDGTTFVGTGSSGFSPSHVYAAAGNYTATVTVNGGGGGVGRAGVELEVVAAGSTDPLHPPVPAIQVIRDAVSCSAPFLVGTPVCFNAGPTWDPMTDVRVLTFDWDFGDGTSYSGVGHAGFAPPAHAYSHPGAFTTTVTVTDPDGLSASAFTRVRVFP